MYRVIYVMISFFCISVSAQDLQTVFRGINKDALAHSKGYDYLKELTATIGHRYSGSENGAKAEEYVYSLFKGLGMADVKFMEFEFPGWMRGKLAVKYYAKSKPDEFIELKAAAFAFAPDSANINAEVIDLNNGLEKDFINRSKKIQGKILLINTRLITTDTSLRNISIRAKADFARKYKAKAVIFIDENDKGALSSRKLSDGSLLYSIPVININRFEGEKLRSCIRFVKKICCSIEMSNQHKIFKARNVIATIKGSDLPDEYIIVGAHLDSWDLGTGAIDNGLGAMEVIDIARVFQSLNLKTKRTLVFINFMGEEQFLYGSRAYLKSLKDENLLDKVKLMLNLDISGNPVGFKTSSEGLKQTIDSVGRFIYEIDSTFKNKNFRMMGTHTDHQAFMVNGITVMRPYDNLNLKRNDCYHADCDRFDLIYKPDMINQNRFTTMLLYSLTNAVRLPLRLNDNETKVLMLKLNLKNGLIDSGDWRWEK